MMNETVNLLPKFVNERTGLIKRLDPLYHSFLPIKLYVYSAVLSILPQTHPFDLNPLSISGAGRNEEEAILKCIGEAIERYCGYYGSIWGDTIYASYNEIREEAIEPEKFALFSKSQYKQPNFYFKEFDKKTKIHWIKGRNLVTGKDSYIPAQLCFLLSDLANDTNLCYSTSTGLACGRSYEEAVEKAIYEVIERDAFMIMWFNKLKFPILKLKFKNECWLSNTLTNLRCSNYKTYTFILDNHTNIPTYLTATLNVKKGTPLVCFGAASNLNFNKAIQKSILESLCGLIYLFQSEKGDVEFKNDRPIIRDFYDHALLYKNPNRYKNLSFLIEGECKKKKYEYIGYDSYNGSEENLEKLTNLLKQKGYDIIIVNLTPEEFKKLGFWVVKAVIPGFVDLSLGDWILKGGRRIYDVPEKLGFKRKKENELNTTYHPFP